MTGLQTSVVPFVMAVMFFASTNGSIAVAQTLKEFTTRSPLDGQTQTVRYWAPDLAASQATPVFVFLHSWSSDYRQDNSKWLQQAVQRGWIYLHPDFRGINQSPKACGSPFARRDILDAIDAVSRMYRVDNSRIYLAGVSGGGHMSMLMAGHHPERFSAVSAWVGISDLAAWHQFHLKDGKPQKYARMIEASLGGPPGETAQRDADYQDRSPLFHIDRLGSLPISIYAGVQDGHSGSVPVSHSLRAFNKIAAVRNATPVSEQEIEQLWTQKKLTDPAPSDLSALPNFGRDILLHRTAGNATVTIFDGGHESLPEPACDWLQEQRRKVTTE